MEHRYEARIRPEVLRFGPWVEGQWAKITRALDMLEGRDFRAQNMGQIALGCALGYLDFRHAARDWRHGRPNLSAWAAQMARDAGHKTPRLGTVWR